MKKITKTIKSCLRILVLVTAIVFFISHWFTLGKEKIYDKDGIKIYASEEIDTSALEKVADNALALLKKRGISLEGSTSIVFYNTRDEFRWRNFFISSDALAMNWWPFPYITFAPVDMAHDKQFARKEILNKRPVSSVIAHELTHTYQAEQLNLLGYKIQTVLHKWKTEGMAEVVSESSSVPFDLGLKLFMKDADKDEVSALDINGEYFYFKSHLKVDYLLNHKKLPEDKFWSTDLDEDNLEKEIRQAIRSGQYNPREQF